MIALYIILGLLVLIGVVLLLPVELAFLVNDDVSLDLKVLFYKQKILPSKKKNHSTDKSNQSGNDGSVKKLIGEKGVFSTVSDFLSVAKLLLGKVAWILGKINIQKLEGKIIVAEEDAAKTGIEYGAVCSVVYPVIGFLGTKTDISKVDVGVCTDFDSDVSKINLEGKISLRIFYLATAAISALVGYIKIKVTNNSADNITERKK